MRLSLLNVLLPQEQLFFFKMLTLDLLKFMFLPLFLLMEHQLLQLLRNPNQTPTSIKKINPALPSSQVPALPLLSQLTLTFGRVSIPRIYSYRPCTAQSNPLRPPPRHLQTILRSFKYSTWNSPGC